MPFVVPQVNCALKHCHMSIVDNNDFLQTFHHVFFHEEVISFPSTGVACRL